MGTPTPGRACCSSTPSARTILPSRKRLSLEYLQEAWSSSDRAEATVDKDLLPLVITESPQQGHGCGCGILVLRNAKARPTLG
ncbi:unnamed protein product, partial [Ectocarpus sp. 6 AP-2014]